MIQSRLCKMIGIKYPIIQAGMGPFSNNNLCVAAANAGVLGLLSTSGLFNKHDQPWVYNSFCAVSYTHLRAHETVLDLVCRLLLEKKKQITTN